MLSAFFQGIEDFGHLDTPNRAQRGAARVRWPKRNQLEENSRLFRAAEQKKAALGHARRTSAAPPRYGHRASA